MATQPEQPLAPASNGGGFKLKLKLGAQQPPLPFSTQQPLPPQPSHQPLIPPRDQQPQPIVHNSPAPPMRHTSSASVLPAGAQPDTVSPAKYRALKKKVLQAQEVRERWVSATRA